MPGLQPEGSVSDLRGISWCRSLQLWGKPGWELQLRIRARGNSVSLLFLWLHFIAEPHGGFAVQRPPRGSTLLNWSAGQKSCAVGVLQRLGGKQPLPSASFS